MIDHSRTKVVGRNRFPLRLQHEVCVSRRRKLVHGVGFDVGRGFEVSFGSTRVNERRDCQVLRGGNGVGVGRFT